MSEGQYGGLAVEAECRNDFVRPVAVKLCVREPIRGGEGAARIYHDDVKAARRRDRDQCLSNVNRADEEKPRPRVEDMNEELALRDFMHRALAGAERIFQRLRQRIVS